MGLLLAGLAAIAIRSSLAAPPVDAQSSIWPAPLDQSEPAGRLEMPALDEQQLRLSLAELSELQIAQLVAESEPQEQEANGAPAAETGQPQNQMSDSEIATKLSNPVGDIWSITNQYNINELRGRPFSGSRWQNNWNIQPVMPLHLTDDWNLINRPVIPLFFYSPYPKLELRPGLALPRFVSRRFLREWRPTRALRTAGAGFDLRTERYCGIGDIAFVSMLSPRKLPKLGDGQILWGAGPTFIFPTASPKELGQGKYQAGPAAVVGFLNDKWIALAFAQQWWSFAGQDGRPNQNHMSLQYTAQYQIAPGLQIGCGAPIVNIDWTRPCRNALTLPVGASISKVFRIGKLPIKVMFEYDYAVVNPDDELGQRNIFRITVAPVLPALIKQNLLGG